MGILSVKRLASSFPAASIEQPASATPITLDVDQDSDLFIGGVPDDYLVSDVIVLHRLLLHASMLRRITLHLAAHLHFH